MGSSCYKGGLLTSEYVFMYIRWQKNSHYVFSKTAFPRVIARNIELFKSYLDRAKHDRIRYREELKQVRLKPEYAEYLESKKRALEDERRCGVGPDGRIAYTASSATPRGSTGMSSGEEVCNHRVLVFDWLGRGGGRTEKVKLTLICDSL